MWEIILSSIEGVTGMIYGAADPAIGGVCSFSFQYIFPAVAGLVIGFALIRSMTDDDLAESGSRLLWVVIPMAVVVWLIKPDGGGCKVLDVKNSFVELRGKLVNVVAPGYGATPDALLRKIAEDTKAATAGFMGTAGEALQKQTEVAGGK